MADPTIIDNVVYEQSDSYSIGDYSYPIVVDPNTIYEVRAFVEDSEGNIYYGETVEVTTVLLVDLTIDPQIPIINVYDEIEFSVLGTYSDDTTQDLTSLVSWGEIDCMHFIPSETEENVYENLFTSGNEVATINSSGVATGLYGGIAKISAELGDISTYTLLVVQPLLNEDSPTEFGEVEIAGGWNGGQDPYEISSNLSSISMVLDSPILVSQSQKALILGLYSDGTQEIIPQTLGTWTSSNTSVATVDDTGLVIGISSGVTFIKVEVEAGESPYDIFSTSKFLTVNEEGQIESSTMNLQYIPLEPLPNQSFRATIATDENRRIEIDFKFSWNEEAGYWTMTLIDAGTGNYLVDSIPLFAGEAPTLDLLSQYKHLNIGSCYLLNISGLESDIPTKENLGIDYVLCWSYTHL